MTFTKDEMIKCLIGEIAFRNVMFRRAAVAVKWPMEPLDPSRQIACMRSIIKQLKQMGTMEERETLLAWNATFYHQLKLAWRYLAIAAHVLRRAKAEAMYIERVDKAAKLFKAFVGRGREARALLQEVRKLRRMKTAAIRACKAWDEEPEQAFQAMHELGRILEQLEGGEQ